MIKLLLLAALMAQAGPITSQIQEQIGQGINAEAKPADLKSPRLPPGISLDRPLSAEDAVAIALWNNAAFHADLASLGRAAAQSQLFAAFSRWTQALRIPSHASH